MQNAPSLRVPLVIPWLQLDTAKVPDGPGELRLMRRGAEFSIMTGSTELMNSRLSGSEQGARHHGLRAARRARRVRRC